MGKHWLVNKHDCLLQVGSIQPFFTLPYPTYHSLIDNNNNNIEFIYRYLSKGKPVGKFAVPRPKIREGINYCLWCCGHPRAVVFALPNWILNTTTNLHNSLKAKFC
jgi:hypothetical protein